MATYIDTTQSKKPGIGGMVWLAVVAVVVAAALTVALVALRGGEPAKSTSGRGAAGTHISTNTDGPWSTVVLKDGSICPRCAP